MMTWVIFVVRALVSLAVIGVALGVVRPKMPRSAYSLAAAGALDLLTSCCVRGVYSGVDYQSMDYETIDMMTTSAACFDSVQTLLVGVLVIASCALMAKEGKPAEGAPPPAVR